MSKMNYNLDDKFLKPYDPASTESKIYQKWLDSGFFNPDICVEKNITEKSADVFSIVLPPPNVTGTMHIGHAQMLAIQDAIVRFKRMRGKKTLWLPGTDHASIATQTKVEKIIQKETDQNRHDLGREKFLEKVEKYAQESHDTIVNQIKSMGASVDWSREAFTLDEIRQKAVYTAFEKMYNDGLIYRKNRIVNWDPKGQTTVSDEEVNHEPTKAKMYYFKYSHDFPITIATTRPETKLGDTAVAVNPEDERYKDYIGKTFNIDFVGVPLEIKIIADKEIDAEFGTGAVGITPAHSFTDYEIAERHNLKSIKVINEYAKIEISDPELNSKKTTVAREIIIERLKNAGLIEKIEEIEQNISTAERTGAVIEPLPKLQWWINVNKKFKNQKNGKEMTLREMMIDFIKEEEIKILPDRFEKIYLNWIENLRDWCISRQIWYGHRIPVWYKKDKDGNILETKVSQFCPEENTDWIQDEDTLDTWFSSGLWTFSTLGWPENTDDFKKYHPTDLLETGYDIIFFWVARMILMSGYLIGDKPFKTVYLHGLVRDEKGKKMSKSLGNGIDPVEINNKYGADALRMSLLVAVGPGSDLNLGENKIKAYKKFSNKIWNASRYVFENIKDFDFDEEIDFTESDQKHKDELEKTLIEITDDIENYRLYLASEKLYHYFWHNFADIIIEESKKNISSDDLKIKKSSQKLIIYILKNCLIALHPFMPFVTEEIWQHTPKNKEIGENDLLLSTKWPIK